MDILLLLLKSQSNPLCYYELIAELFFSSLLTGVLTLFIINACEIILHKIKNIFVNNS